MTSFSRPLAASLLLLLLQLMASSVVKATLNLTLHYELREDSPPGTVIGTENIYLATNDIMPKLNNIYR